MEFEFLRAEYPDKFGGEHFSDPNYEAWVKKAQEEDRKLTLSTAAAYTDEVDVEKLDAIKKRLGMTVSIPKTVEKVNVDDENQWEDVEVDDLPLEEP